MRYEDSKNKVYKKIFAMKGRKTKKRVTLKTGEVERKDGYYTYRWTVQAERC